MAATSYNVALKSCFFESLGAAAPITHNPLP
jgi:hypothetical protein